MGTTNQYKITGTANYYTPSVTVQFTPVYADFDDYNPTALFHLNIGELEKDLELVHLPYTDGSFLRDFGKVSRLLTVTGTCTADSYSDILAKMWDIERLKGDKCSIYYNGVTFTEAYLMESTAEGPKLCTSPGFYMEFDLSFRQFDPDGLTDYPS